MDAVATAYHESGHAIIHCVFGEAKHVHSVVLGSKFKDVTGQTVIHTCAPLWHPSQVSEGIRDEKCEDLRRSITRFVINCLAGQAAEVRALPDYVEADMDWYEQMLDTTDRLEEKPFAEDLDPREAFTDFDLAFIAAVQLNGRRPKKVGQFLDDCANKTDQLIANPIVWECIDDVAKSLLSDDIMAGSRLLKFQDRLDKHQLDLPC